MEGWEALGASQGCWLLRAVPVAGDALLCSLSDGAVLYSERVSDARLQQRAVRLNPDLDLEPGVLRRLLRSHALPPREVGADGDAGLGGGEKKREREEGERREWKKKREKERRREERMRKRRSGSKRREKEGNNDSVDDV